MFGSIKPKINSLKEIELVITQNYLMKRKPCSPSYSEVGPSSMKGRHHIGRKMNMTVRKIFAKTTPCD